MKRHMKCRIGGSFGAGEIPPFVLFLYLFNEAELDLTVQLLALRSFAGRSGLKTLSGGEFGWGGTSVKPQRRCPKGDSWRTEISSRTKG